MDFPSATDSAVLGINDVGSLVGSYDLGDPSTSIGFADTRGVFASIQDPGGPLQTQAVGINTLNFISGVYADAAGVSHGFVRDLTAQFHNFDFPGADFTIGTRINDFGQIVGNYATNFPQHGFILSGVMSLTGSPSPSQAFSFENPDSRLSLGRGINNLGQISGSFFLRGDPVTRVHRDAFDGPEPRRQQPISPQPRLLLGFPVSEILGEPSRNG